MAMATATILGLTALAIAGAGTGYQIKTGIDARKDAKDEAGRREQEQAKAIAEAKTERERQDKAIADEAAKADALESAATMRIAAQKKRSGTTPSTRGGTILTSPLGVVGSSSSGQKKTLLGQ